MAFREAVFTICLLWKPKTKQSRGGEKPAFLGVGGDARLLRWDLFSPCKETPGITSSQAKGVVLL